MNRCLIPFTVAAVALLSSCGGGGGGGTSSVTSTISTTPTTIVLHLVTSTSTLPGAVQGKPYSTTMTAAGGQPPYHWALSQPSNGIPGLSVDASSGTLSGTPTTTGYFSVMIVLSDSASPVQTVNIPMNLVVSAPMQATAGGPLTFSEYSSGSVQPLSVQGGVMPFTYSVSGALPRGLTLNTTSGYLGGTAIVQGSFAVSVTVSDSFTPPETATVPVTLTVGPPPFSLAPSLPSRLAVNKPFSGKVIAVGGVPPYTYILGNSQQLPPGLSFDPSSGTVSGTPTTIGGYNFAVTATDSNTTPSRASQYYSMQVATPLGRNDSVGTATPIGNVSIFASISPYEDPPTSAPLAADHDYYKVVAQGGQVVQLQAVARTFNQPGPLDTVLEVLDANGNRLNSCGPPRSTTVSDVCVNDDNGSTTDSAIQVQVPGAPNTTSAIYVDVLDWRGDARPDMQYMLTVSGALEPLRLVGAPNTLWAVVGKSGTVWTFYATGGGVPYTWSVASGSLPPGLSLDASSGVLSGIPTTAGSYPVTVLLTDALSQTQQENLTVSVAAPLSLTSSGPLPDGIAGQQYSYQFVASGGGSPLNWSAFATPNLYGSLNMDYFTGVYSGVAQQAGPYTVTVTVRDPAGQQVMRTFSLTMHPAASLTVQVGGNNIIYGFVGTTVPYSVTALYGTPPYTFTATPGIPPGVILNSNGFFAGAPTDKGTYLFGVTATDSSNPRVSGTASLTMIVN